MSNDYYNKTGNPQSNSAGSSSLIRAEFTSIEAMAGKLAPLATNADKVIVVNATGTAQDVVARDVLVAGVTHAGASKTTPVDADELPLSDSAASFGFKKLTWANIKATLASWINGGTIPGAFTTLSATSSVTSNDGTNGTVQIGTTNYKIQGGASYAGLRYQVPTASTHDLQVNGILVAQVSSTGLAVTGALSSTGNTTLGDASTDTVTVNGYMGVGGAPQSNVGIWLRNTLTSSANQYGILASVTGASAATTQLYGFTSDITVPNAAFTYTDVADFRALPGIKGASATLTNKHGVYIADQTQGTNNYGITSGVSSGTNKWNIYASGTADNYFAGNVGVGTSAPANPLEVRGTLPLRLSRDLLIGSGNGFGAIDFAGRYDATNYGLGARVQALGDGAWSGTSYPSYLSFQTVASGSTALTERLRLDSAGNLGLGVTPSAWGTSNSTRAMQIGNALSIFATTSVSTQYGSFGTNVYQNAGLANTYLTTDFAELYLQNSGQHRWFTAPSGTAGNAITFTQSLSVGNGTTLALEGATSATGTGIAFPATQVASSNANTLDDYEEGTFTPTIVGTTTAGTGTYTAQFGRYTKIGNRVYFDLQVVWTAHTGTGNMVVGGLPFTSGASAFSVLPVYSSNLTFPGQLAAVIGNASSQVVIRTIATGAVAADLAIDTAAEVRFSGHYEV